MKSIYLKIKIKRIKKHLKNICFRLKCALLILFVKDKFFLTVFTQDNHQRKFIDSYNFMLFKKSQQSAIIDVAIVFAELNSKEEECMNKLLNESKNILNAE